MAALLIGAFALLLVAGWFFYQAGFENGQQKAHREAVGAAYLALQEAYMASRPLTVDGRCESCGAAEQPESPPYLMHKNDCMGVARSSRVWAVVAAWQKQNPSVLRPAHDDESAEDDWTAV